MTRQGLRQSLYTTQEGTAEQHSSTEKRRESSDQEGWAGAPTRKKKGKEEGEASDRVLKMTEGKGGEAPHRVADHPLSVHGSG